MTGKKTIAAEAALSWNSEESLKPRNSDGRGIKRDD